MWSGSSPASTTRGGQLCTSGWVSRRSPLWRGRPSGVLRRLLPDTSGVEWVDPSAKVTLIERQVGAVVGGHRYSEMEDPGAVRVMAVSRLGVAQVPGPSLVAQEGDIAYLAVGGGARAARRATFDAEGGGPPMKVTIAGGGSVGRFIAEQLAEASHDVTIIDSDPAVVGPHEAAGDPKGAAWVQGDACEITTSAVPAPTLQTWSPPSPATTRTTSSSLFSPNRSSACRGSWRVNNPKNEWMFNDMWGVDVAVSTPHLLTGLVQEAVTVGSFVRLLSFEGGKAKLAEVTLAGSVAAVGKEIVELRLRDSTVVAVIRHDHVVVPAATPSCAGDEVLVLVTLTRSPACARS